MSIIKAWPVIAALLAPASAAAASSERFAEAFGLEPAEERAVCDAVLRLPPSPLAAAAPESADGLPAAVPLEPERPPAPKFLASIGIPVKNTQYDARWRDVQEAGLSFECASFVLDRAGPPASAEDLAAFNRLVNQIVRYVEDRERDDWAKAADTLRTGRGDCEDIAILKLQLLMAVGMREEDGYFTLVRDTQRGRDHAIAVVRLGGRSWMLDSTEDGLRDADGTVPSYQAVVAFSGTRKWLLGRERQAISALPVTARSSPR